MAITSLPVIRSEDGSRESVPHFDAKHLVARMAQENGNCFIVAVEGATRYWSYEMNIPNAKVVIECSEKGEPIESMRDYRAKTGRLPLMVFDVGFVLDGTVVAAIEVVQAHGIDSRKAAKIYKAGILCVSVKAATYHWHVDNRRIEAIHIVQPPNAVVKLVPLSLSRRNPCPPTPCETSTSNVISGTPSPASVTATSES